MSTDDLNLRVVVRAELDSAFDNGQFGPGGYLWEGPDRLIGADELALDLACFSPSCDGLAVNSLQPHAVEWLKENEEKLRRLAKS